MRWLDLFAKGLANPARGIAWLSGSARPKDSEYQRLRSWRYGALKRIHATELYPDLMDVDLQLRRAFHRRIGTSLDLFELAIICGIARARDARSVLEIGTYDGNTALNLAANTHPDATITTVDLPTDWDGAFTLPIPTPSKHVSDLGSIGVQFSDDDYRSKIVQVLGDSAALDWSTLGGPFDLVLVDGCHHYEYVRSDTENALRVLAPRGVVLWHDYGQIYDVSRVVDEQQARMKVVAFQGTRLAMAENNSPE